MVIPFRYACRRRTRAACGIDTAQTFRSGSCQMLSCPFTSHARPQEAHQRNIGPLLPHEIAVLEEQLRFYGRQPKRWELIVAQHMPYRTIPHLSKLWGAHQAGLEKNAPGEALLCCISSWSRASTTQSSCPLSVMCRTCIEIV